MKPEATLDPTLTIRRGRPEDAVLLAELGARTFKDTFATENTPENMAAYLAESFNPAQQTAELNDPRCLFLMAEVSGVAVGYAMLRAEKVGRGVTGGRPIELVRLYVSKDSLGHGRGAALMQACINEARQRGHDSLWLGVWEHNLRAQEFYRKWNFHEVGTQVFQLGDDPQTDLVMQRELS